MCRFFLVIGSAYFFGCFAVGQENSSANWPQFRGPEGRGVAPDAKALPVQLGPEKAVLWKTVLPEGISSPCIWGNKIFLTGFDPKKQKLETLCLDRRNGAILWRQTAPAKNIESVYKINSPAAATPACDGKRVVVSFGSYGLLCYDLDGKELWRRPLPRPPTVSARPARPFLPATLCSSMAREKTCIFSRSRQAMAKSPGERREPPSLRTIP